MTSNPRPDEAKPFDWRGPLFGAAAAAIIGLIVAWSARPTPESAQQASSNAAVIATQTQQISTLNTVLTSLGVKMDVLTERSYQGYTRADAAADRAEAARRSDALEARLVRLEQTVSDLQRRTGVTPTGPPER